MAVLHGPDGTGRERPAYLQGAFPVLSKKTLAKEIYDYTVFCPEIAALAQPGQFVTLGVKGFSLRRPVSLCGIDAARGTIRLVFEIRGKGTKALAVLNEGDQMDVFGPLGKGFQQTGISSAVLVGGGIGAPPMLTLAEIFGEKCTVISGFRSAGAAILQEDFIKTGARALLCTDDGTAGRKGFVTEALREELSSRKPDMIFACGPMLMLKGVVEIAKEQGIPSQVSLEERMGCGVGACLVCACRTVKNGEEIFSHVCKDGPVFDGEEALFHG